MTDQPRAVSDDLSVPRRRAFREWLAYTIALALLVTLFCGPLIYSALTSDRTGLCFLIGALFVLALGRNLVDVLFIDHQMSLAQKQVSELVSIRKIGPFIRQCESSLLRDHLVNLHEIAKRDPHVTQDNLVVLLQSRLNSRLRLTDSASAVLVTLGLVGTIIGLIASVSGVSDVMAAVGTDKTALLGGMQHTLGGMGTAFYTTLLGALIGGIVLRILSTIVASHADHLVAHIAELSEVHILPALRNASRRRERDSLNSGDSLDL